ncbi:MAG: hypothetical protein M1816_003836 [Peltula sp. TS41687]|nr:MAG: hypothetical protein M1816_003836 [Peltula sp. TS41687]
MSTSTSVHSPTSIQSPTSISPNSHSSASSFSSYSDANPSYTWINDHIFMFPQHSYVGLDGLFQYNASQLRPSAPPPLASSIRNSILVVGAPLMARPKSAARSSFEKQMVHIMQQPTRPEWMPVYIINNLMKFVFDEDIAQVQFGFALKGLDYLIGLESRRHRELGEAFARLGLKADNASFGSFSAPEEVAGPAGKLDSWRKSIDDKVKTIEGLYTQVYVGLRRWICFNQMSFVPYSWVNCMAMLNTLFPPVNGAAPTRYLTPALVHEQRENLRRCMQAVEQNGPMVLESFKQHGRNVLRGDTYGWQSLHDLLQLYLEATSALIDECAAIKVDYSIPNGDGEGGRREGGKPSTRGTGLPVREDRRPSTANKDKPLPAWPTQPLPNHELSSKELPNKGKTPSQPAKGGRMLDKLARKFAFFGNRKKEDTEKKEDDAKTRSLRKAKSTTTLRELRKAKSTGTLRDLNGKNGSSVAVGSMRNRNGMGLFDDVEYEELRQKTIEEARERAAREAAKLAAEVAVKPKPKSRPVLSFEV